MRFSIIFSALGRVSSGFGPSSSRWRWPLLATALMALVAFMALAALSAPRAAAQSQETIRLAILVLENELDVVPEDRCARYDRKAYKYNSRKLEDALIESRDGQIISWYTGEIFDSHRDTDLDHIIALAQAHDSGACAWDSERKSEFASDIDNFELATPRMNRHQKRAKDWAEWQPPQEQCYFASKIVMLKMRYDLTVDEAERDALAETLSDC